MAGKPEKVEEFLAALARRIRVCGWVDVIAALLWGGGISGPAVVVVVVLVLIAVSWPPGIYHDNHAYAGQGRRGAARAAAGQVPA